MALTDLVLKAKANMALVRDPRVSAAAIKVSILDGVATISGDLYRDEECKAAEDIVAGVAGITAVHNVLTCGVHARHDNVEILTLRLLEKLDDEWLNRPDSHAVTEADYLRWALHLIHRFRLPETIKADDPAEVVATIVDKALAHVGGYVGASRVMLAIEMQRQAEILGDLVAPHAVTQAASPVSSA